MPRLEYRAIQSAVELVDAEKREIQGHAVSWEVLNDWDEVFERGAFQQAIEEDLPRRKIKAMYWHRDLVGVITDLREDNKGLFYRGTVIETEKGEEFLQLVREKVLDGASVGFRARKVVWDEKDEETHGTRVRRIQNAKLFEISGVPWGSDDTAYVEMARSMRAGLEDLDAEAVAASSLDHLRWLAAMGHAASQELERRLAAQAEAEDPDGAKKRALAVQIAETLKSQRGRLIQLTERSV